MLKNYNNLMVLILITITPYAYSNTFKTAQLITENTVIGSSLSNSNLRSYGTNPALSISKDYIISTMISWSNLWNISGLNNIEINTLINTNTPIFIGVKSLSLDSIYHNIGIEIGSNLLIMKKLSLGYSYSFTQEKFSDIDKFNYSSFTPGVLIKDILLLKNSGLALGIFAPQVLEINHNHQDKEIYKFHLNLHSAIAWHYKNNYSISFINQIISQNDYYDNKYQIRNIILQSFEPHKNIELTLAIATKPVFWGLKIKLNIKNQSTSLSILKHPQLSFTKSADLKVNIPKPQEKNH